MSLGTHEIDFLKETLQAQQELLQKLYQELDVERESSAIAADETLSMILRLQGEKSAMEMEASQYKRIAEEKMCHAQEMVETFQELIYQKEMQIASLAFQVQAYRFKLASLGCEDLAAGDFQYPENMLSRRNGFAEETSSHSSIRRGNSLPPIPDGALSRRASTEGTGTESSSPKAEPSLRRESTSHGDFNSYWKEIKKLDERVKGFTQLNNLNGFPTPGSTVDIPSSSQLNLPARTSLTQNPSPDNSPGKMVFHEYAKKVHSVQPCEVSPCSTSVQDIFEVPQCPEDDLGGLSHKTETSELSLKRDDAWNTEHKQIIDWEKQPLLAPDTDRSSPKPKDVEQTFDMEKKPLLSVNGHTSSPKQKDGKTEKQKLFKHPTYGVADFELQQFNRRLKQLEDERFVTRGREINSEAADEELKLLREIMEKVEALQSEISSLKPKKPPSPEDRSFGCFKEAMLCFLP
ncbi:hypothetical protein vseg_016221 [Gypsophila vaccaria]